MSSVKSRVVLALALLLSLAPAAARAQEEQQQKSPAPGAAQQQSSPGFERFRNRVFEVTHRDPVMLASVLHPLGSGHGGALISPNREFKTITVRDYAANIAVIEEAIKRFDRPVPAPPSVEFQIHMLVASNDPAASNRFPAELNEAVSRLQPSLGYKSYTLMGSQVVRSREGRGEIYNKGVADLKLTDNAAAGRNPVFYNYTIRAVSLDPTASPGKVEVEEFSLDMKIPLLASADKVVYEDVGFKNPVSLRQGERVVVGTTSVGDKSVVVILSATSIR
ncbi:MAG TPA: hypothetical protein VD968_15700 [Pyrinomonadaceae bacterium]|nr:hypothetical protein [Pyrinomonadaceae bacterium]